MAPWAEEAAMPHGAAGPMSPTSGVKAASICTHSFCLQCCCDDMDINLLVAYALSRAEQSFRFSILRPGSKH